MKYCSSLIYINVHENVPLEKNNILINVKSVSPEPLIWYRLQRFRCYFFLLSFIDFIPASIQPLFIETTSGNAVCVCVCAFVVAQWHTLLELTKTTFNHPVLDFGYGNRMILAYFKACWLQHLVRCYINKHRNIINENSTL